MLPSDAARNWSETWQVAWQDLDTEAVVALYSSDAVMSTEPFRQPYHGREGIREYVSSVFAEEEDPVVHVSAPIVDGQHAVVSWWASLREEGADTVLAGTSVLRFDEEGLVVEQWDTWNRLPSRRDPPHGWGPFSDHR